MTWGQSVLVPLTFDRGGHLMRATGHRLGQGRQEREDLGELRLGHLSVGSRTASHQQKSAEWLLEYIICLLKLFERKFDTSTFYPKEGSNEHERPNVRSDQF